MTRLIFSLITFLIGISATGQSNRCLKKVLISAAKGTIVICNDEAQIVSRTKPVEVIAPCNQNATLPVIVVKDSVTRQLEIMPVKTHSGWRYPRHIYIGLNDTGNVYYRTKPLPKKYFTANFSVLPFNQFSLRYNAGDSSTTGIQGGSFGFNYHYDFKHFWSVQAGFATDDATANFGKGRYTDTSNFATTSAYFVNIRHNRKIGDFDIGYGLAFSHHRFDQEQVVWKDAGGQTISRSVYKNAALAASLSGYWRVGKVMAVGLLYQPQFLALQNMVRFKYEHIISLDIAFRLPLKRGILFN